MARNKYPEETIQKIQDAAARLFFEKGYDGTSLQDIIDETKLSKGAIYHHFRSKEEIFEAVCERMGAENVALLAEIRDDAALNGHEKLRELFRAALSNANQRTLVQIAPNLLENPRFLAAHVREIYELIAPKFIRPVLEQGIRDGSIETEAPEELAEAMMILSNLWLNPLICPADEETMERRYRIFIRLLRGAGIDLADEWIVGKYKEYCQSLQEGVKREESQAGDEPLPG